MHAHIMHTLFNRLQKDVDILVKVARQWAGCLTWSRVSHGGWSYPGITTKLLKQDLHKPQIEVGARQAGRQAGRQSSRQTGSYDGPHLLPFLPKARNTNVTVHSVDGRG